MINPTHIGALVSRHTVDQAGEIKLSGEALVALDT